MRKTVVVNKTHREAQLRLWNGYGGDPLKIESISKTRHVIVAGQHHSGKSGVLLKLLENAELIWFDQCKPYAYTEKSVKENKPVLKQGQKVDDVWSWPEPIWLGGNDPLSKWAEHEGVAAWWEKLHPEQPYKKMKAWQKPEVFAAYLKATRAILFIDDAHKLNGRKLVIAKACFMSAYRVVISCGSANAIAPSLRVPLLKLKPQILQLNTDAAYDATHLLVWFFVFLLTVAGMTEAAALLAMFETLKGGRNAAKQN